MIQINAPKYPIKIDIKDTITTFFQPYMDILFNHFNVPKEEQGTPFANFDKENNTLDVLACNTLGVSIQFFIIPITETISHLRTEIAQKTFLKILLMHELLHSVNKKDYQIKTDKDYEIYTTYQAIDILQSKNLINYNDLFSEYRRSKYYGTPVKTKEHLYLINLMYPIEMSIKGNSVKGKFYNGEQFG